MIPPEILKRKSLFSLLYQIDQELSERTQARGCPIAGARCIAPITSESLEVGPRILKRLLRFASACAAAGKAAGVVYSRHRFGFGVAGFIGRLYFYWSAPFVRGKTLPSPWSGSKGYAACGVQPSNAGNDIFETYLPKASVIDVYPVI
jgi:hypothetical protein